MTERVVPWPREAEQAVLGAMLINASAIPVVNRQLSASDFYLDHDRDIYHSILTIWGTDKDAVDVVTVAEALPQYAEEIHTYAEFCPAATNAAHYAERVKHASTCRALITAGQEIAELGYADGDDTVALVDTAERKLAALHPDADSGTKRIRDGLEAFVKRLEDGTPPQTVSTGFRSLDDKTGGMRASNFIVLGARPGGAKTALALSIAYKAAKEGVVLFASIEMSSDELIERIACSTANIKLRDARDNTATQTQMTNLYSSLSDLESSNLRIVDSPALTFYSLKEKCRRFASKDALKLVVIDYLQLMTLGQRSESRYAEVSIISRQLKSLARELKVPVLALSQLNRSGQFDPSAKPELHQLRESGSLEQDADQVWLLSYPKEEPGFTKEVVVDVAKNRHGATGEVRLIWCPEYQQFENQ